MSVWLERFPNQTSSIGNQIPWKYPPWEWDSTVNSTLAWQSPLQRWLASRDLLGWRDVKMTRYDGNITREIQQSWQYYQRNWLFVAILPEKWSWRYSQWQSWPSKMAIRPEIRQSNAWHHINQVDWHETRYNLTVKAEIKPWISLVSSRKSEIPITNSMKYTIRDVNSMKYTPRRDPNSMIY